MSMSNDDNFGLPPTPESGVLSRNNSSDTADSYVQNLLNLDESALNDVELDITCGQVCRENSEEYQEEERLRSSDLKFIEELNKSRFCLDDNLTQDTNDYDDWGSVTSETNGFQRQNSSINEELSDSVNLLKSKLFSSFGDGEVPIKRRHVDGKSNVAQTRYPFYGLPDKVKDLIKRHKGIEKLYGEYFRSRYFGIRMRGILNC